MDVVNNVTVSAGVRLIILDVVLFIIGCLALLIAKSFPQFMPFWVTLSLGMFIIIFITIFHYYYSEKRIKQAEKQQKDNIVPGYCPDYWTKAQDPISGKLICKNGYSVKNADNQTISYKFSDPSVPESIDMETVNKSTNAFKCKAYATSLQFPAPWMEMKAKCDAVTY
jgi:hypothetical protein